MKHLPYPRSLVRTAAIAAFGMIAAAMSGCMNSNTYGVDIQNKTGQNLRVEYLQVGSDGTTKVYSTGHLAPKGGFTNREPAPEQGFGKRVRFSLPDRPPEDAGAHVELKLSEEKARYYDLVVTNGRLMAKEYVKGRTPTASSDLLGGDGR
jgi:hypothetical protein